MIKRILCMALSVIMIFSMSVNVFAFNPFDDFDNDAEEMQDYADAQSFNMNAYISDMNTYVLRILKWTKDYDSASAAAAAEALKKATSISTYLSTGVRSVSGVLGLVNGTVSFLRVLGVLETPGTSTMNSIYETVLDIRESVDQINIKTDEIRNTLDSEFSKIDYNFNITQYSVYQQAWSDFFAQGNSVAKMDELFAEYQSQVNVELLGYVKQWQNSCDYGIRALYNEDSEPILLYSGDNMDGAGKALPVLPSWSDDSLDEGINYNCKVANYITLPGEYIKVKKVKLNADNCIGELYDALVDGVSRAIADKALIVGDSNFYENFETKSAEEQAELCEMIAEDLVNSLSYDISHDVANSSVSGSGTFASRVKAAYDVYCNTVAGNNSVTSPMTSAFQRLSLTHGFEGEIKSDYAEVAMYLYALTSHYSSFASYVCALDDSMKSSVKDEVADENMKAMAAIVNYTDTYMTGNDNYCYPLGCAIEYHDIAFTATHTLYFKSKKDPILTTDHLQDLGEWHLIDKTVSYPSATDADYEKTVSDNETKLQSTMLSTRDMALLYYYYLNYVSESGSSGDFLDYLCTNDALLLTSPDATTEDRSKQLITSGYSVSKLTFNEGIELTAHVEDDVTEHLVYEEGQLVMMDTKAFDKGYDYRGYGRQSDKVVGDLFDVTGVGTMGVKASTNVSSRILRDQVYTARFYSHPTYELYWSQKENEKMHVRGEEYTGVEGDKVVEHFVFTDGEFTSGKDAFEDSQFGPITSVIEKSMGALVAVPAGNITIGANVEKVDKNTVKSKNVQCLTIASHETEIASDAFVGFGTKTNRVLLNPVHRGALSLVGQWKGGYFGNGVITLASGNKAAQTKKIVVAYGDATKNISCPFTAENGMIFSGWNAETVNDSTGTLTAEWSNHVHEPEYISKEPTCTESGYTTYKVCKICGKQLTNPVALPATGHNFSFSSIDSKRIGKCSHCGKELEFIIGDIGNFHIAISGSSSSEAVEYTRASGASSGTLTIKNDAVILIRNKNEGSSTTDTISVADGVSANIFLDGVNIKSGSSAGVPAFGIADDSTGQVVITLVDGSVNTLHSGANCAGIQKNGSDGTLTINGTGTLAAIGGSCGAGIGSAGIGYAAFGSSGIKGTANITINGGNIYAASDDKLSAGIGAAFKDMGMSLSTQGIASNIVINGGSVTVDSNEAGIGGSLGSLCIRGGAVTVNAKIGRVSNVDLGTFSVTVYPTASVYIGASSKDSSILNEKRQVVVCHEYSTVDTIRHSIFDFNPEHLSPVTKITVDGYTLPFVKHMEVTKDGKLEAKGCVYLYGPEGDLDVVVERDASFLGSIFSEGSFWLIIGGGVVIIAGVVAAVVVVKRKKEQCNDTKQ